MQAPTVQHFGAQLRNLRRARDLTQEQLAKRAGTSKAYVCQLERGHRYPGVGTLAALAVALDTTPDALLAVPSAA